MEGHDGGCFESVDLGEEGAYGVVDGDLAAVEGF